jgi:hypothetical protein
MVSTDTYALVRTANAHRSGIDAPSLAADILVSYKSTIERDSGQVARMPLRLEELQTKERDFGHRALHCLVYAHMMRITPWSHPK